MNNIIKKETNEKIIEMEVTAFYLPWYEKLDKLGYVIPDLRFRLHFFKDEDDIEICHSYIGFSGYVKNYFLTSGSNEWGIESFEAVMKSKSLERLYEYEDTQMEILEVLKEADEIWEVLAELMNDEE